MLGLGTPKQSTTRTQPGDGIVLYTTPWCPFCIRAKALLDQKHVSYHDIDVAAHPELRQTMQQFSHGSHTVPQIFIGDQHIGGCDELYALERQNTLNSLLKGLS